MCKRHVIIVGNTLEFCSKEAVLTYQNGEKSYPVHEVFAGGERLVFHVDHAQKSMAELYVPLGHIDGADNDGYLSEEHREDYWFDIFCDGALHDTFYIHDDMLPKAVLVDLNGVNQLKIVPHGYNGGNYGIGNPVLK